MADAEEFADAASASWLDIKLEERLLEWARDYLTPQQVGAQNRNILQTLIEHGGFVPTARMVPSFDKTPADQVEEIVHNMRRVGWWLHASVLRLEYWRPSLPMESKLDHLRSDFKIEMSRRDFYRKLSEAKTWMAAALFG